MRGARQGTVTSSPQLSYNLNGVDDKIQSIPVSYCPYFFVLTGGVMLPEAQKIAFEAFFESTENNGIIDEKMTIMIQLAASLAIGCYP
jgi:hypothetical protein